MKLLHVTSTHLKPDGGIPVVLKELVTAQNRIENVNALVISLVARVDDMNSDFFRYVSTDKFERFVLDFNPDFVILHSFYYLKYNKVVRVLTKHKILFFIEPHGSFGNAAMKKSKIKKYIANCTVFRKQLKNSFGYIFLNDSEKMDSVYRTDNDIVIPNGINSFSLKKFNNTNNYNSIYYIGRYDINHKGIDYLMDALQIIDNEGCMIEVNMWGAGDEKSISYISNRIKNFQNLKVYCHDSIYGKEKASMLEQYGPMILTSRYEGFPMTVLEGWMYGNPCIVTPGTNVWDEVVNNNLGWGVELDALSIAHGIVQAVEMYKSNKNQYIENCKNYVLKNYSWDKIAEDSIMKLRKLQLEVSLENK